MLYSSSLFLATFRWNSVIDLLHHCRVEWILQASCLWRKSGCESEGEMQSGRLWCCCCYCRPKICSNCETSRIYSNCVHCWVFLRFLFGGRWRCGELGHRRRSCIQWVRVDCGGRLLVRCSLVGRLTVLTSRWLCPIKCRWCRYCWRHGGASQRGLLVGLYLLRKVMIQERRERWEDIFGRSSRRGSRRLA